MSLDSYKTIVEPTKETLFKDRNSKFFGFSFPVTNEEEVKDCLEEVKKIHHSARHFCYAYQIGVEDVKYRVNDDGEPNNSAGMPIYGQIQSFKVTNILIVVIRYFGGTKLGVGGLINAYKSSAQISLDASEIVEKTIDVSYQLNFEYDMMNKVMRVLKEKNINLISQKMDLTCEYVVSVRKKESKVIFDIFDILHKVDILKLES
ncbi:YigZ family protein [Polaribacter sp.]|uniref:IMPACT family protein n=1 Tax=Polaribacter sp. TaxID=1920175 RepID=UPI00260012B2|nr:YigZ family protein [Polaribacter sp.]